LCFFLIWREEKREKGKRGRFNFLSFFLGGGKESICFELCMNENKRNRGHENNNIGEF